MQFSKTAREAIAQVSMDACSLHKSMIFKVQFECCNTIKAGQSRILHGKSVSGLYKNQYVQSERRKMCVRADVPFRQLLLSCDEVQQDSTRNGSTIKQASIQPSQINDISSAISNAVIQSRLGKLAFTTEQREHAV